MAITGMASNWEGDYICKDDPCTSREDGATVFKIGVIPNAIMMRISDAVPVSQVSYGDMQTQTFQQRTGFRNRECFRFGVKGWDNYFDNEGDPIAYETELHMEGGKTYTVVADQTLNRVFGNTMQEVGAEAFNRNNLTEKQRKNSEEWLSRFAGSDTSSAPNATTTTEPNEDANDQPSETEDETPPPGVAVIPANPMNTGKTQRRGNGKAPVRAS